MGLPEIARLVIGAAYTLVLAAAAISDVRDRRIPNWTVLTLMALFVAFAIVDHGAHLVSALEAGAVSFVISVVLYACKIIGAGDSKLFAAVALFAGLGFLPLLVVATTLTGGLIALVSIVTRPKRAMVMFSLRGKGDWGRGVPYGLAIAVGGAVIMWGPMAGVVRPFGAPAPVSAHDIAREMFRPAAPH